MKPTSSFILTLGFTFGFLSSLVLHETQADEFPPVEQLPEQTELPDPFTIRDGTPVKTPEDWYQKRRPELKELFQHYMYGYAPAVPEMKFKEEAPQTEVLGGKATLKQIEISFPELSKTAPRIHLAVFTPTKSPTPSPLFLAVNKCGNHTVIPDESLVIIPRTNIHSYCLKPDGGARGARLDYWCLEYLIDQGYGFATFQVGDIDPDQHDFTDGIHPHFELKNVPESSRWGTIAAWAWGLQRCVDYLVTDDDIHPGCISVIGHSRRGKTALWAAAMDERIALAVPHQSGTGGMALSRNNNQETVKRINDHFPHWFNDEFTKFNDNEARIPFDQHLLMALVAPRPLLETSGKKDTWANYDSSLKGIQAADAVYKFLGEPGIKGKGMLQDGVPVTKENAGNLLQYRHDTKHVLTLEYWKAILEFADLQFADKLNQ